MTGSLKWHRVLLWLRVRDETTHCVHGVRFPSYSCAACQEEHRKAMEYIHDRCRPLIGALMAARRQLLAEGAPRDRMVAHISSEDMATLNTWRIATGRWQATDECFGIRVFMDPTLKAGELHAGTE